jgi:hypothetical protein
MKKRVENVCSSCINPNTWTITIFASLKKIGNECLKMWEASNVLRLTWNGASIATTTLDFMVILNMLDYISKPLMDKMDARIIFTSKDVLELKKLTSSKRHSVRLDQFQMTIEIFFCITLKPILWITNSHNVLDMKC